MITNIEHLESCFLCRVAGSQPGGIDVITDRAVSSLGRGEDPPQVALAVIGDRIAYLLDCHQVDSNADRQTSIVARFGGLKPAARLGFPTRARPRARPIAETPQGGE